MVAALLAQLSYTGVLTVPQEVSDCQDICTASVLQLSVSLLGSHWLVQNLEPPSVPEDRKYVAATYDVDYIVQKVLNSERELRDLKTSVPKHLTASLQSFLVFNGVALLSSLSCLIIAGVRLQKASSLQQYKSIDVDCLHLVIVSSVSIMAAFIAAHLQVYFISPGLTILLVCVGAFILIIVIGCFFSNFLASPSPAPNPRPDIGPGTSSPGLGPGAGPSRVCRPPQGARGIHCPRQLTV